MPDFPARVDVDEIAQAVWIYTTRRLTNLDDIRAAKIDNLDVLLSSRLSTTHFDDVIGDPTTPPPPVVTTVSDLIKAMQLAVTSLGDVTMSGTEKTVIEVLQSDLSPYDIPFIIEGYVDLSPMQAGDTIVLREYVAIESGVTYKLYATHTYNDAQTEPLIHFTKKLGSYGYKVTAEQTAGTYRTLNYFFGRRRIK